MDICNIFDFRLVYFYIDAFMLKIPIPYNTINNGIASHCFLQCSRLPFLCIFGDVYNSPFLWIGLCSGHYSKPCHFGVTQVFTLAATLIIPQMSSWPNASSCRFVGLINLSFSIQNALGPMLVEDAHCHFATKMLISVPSWHSQWMIDLLVIEQLDLKQPSKHSQEPPWRLDWGQD